MTRLEAHGRFVLMQDREFLPCVDPCDPHFPAIATALAELSGWLEDCESDDDLQAAAEQGHALSESEIVSADEVINAAHAVIAEVIDFGEREGKPCFDS